MSEDKIAYLELPSTDVPALKSFYGQLFSWAFQDYGDDYAAIEGAGLDGGFNGDPVTKPKSPLVISKRQILRRWSSGCRKLVARSQCRSSPIRVVSVSISWTQAETNWP
ncbi:hypothetical protein HDF16_006048 [Granulicella aggregans]|uniref:Uncharacterized protein n=1 Tax=Granulicella aggregans TaxID=474949 RepID=A0A7W7ZJX7_9BACT|nr:hypothetical protein [Granulicella aggregans]MBB5061312.1 hypothetical protein [Granulicella aggregans]